MEKTPMMLVLALLALGAGAPPHGLPRCVHSPFAGITPTDVSGLILGEPDPRDWGCVGEPGNRSSLSARIGGVVGAGALDAPPPPPRRTCLEGAFPNPTSGAVLLRLSIASRSHVSLIVYGQTWRHGPDEVFPVRTLVDGDLEAGLHAVQWDGADDHGARVAPGFYRAVMVVGENAICGDIEIR